MKIIISPAKKMKMDTDPMACKEKPQFLNKTIELKKRLCSMSYEELKALWKCNDKIAAENKKRLDTMRLDCGLAPAIFSYEGIQYQYMAPSVFTYDEFAYIEEHLVILSGFYGMLRPFDGVTPYRLEMQAKLSGDGFSSLYEFWGGLLAKKLAEETELLINLASKEYSRAVTGALPKGVQVLSCVFGELQNGKLIEKGTRCKMARGAMVRFMAENQVTKKEQLKSFSSLGYHFSKEDSTEWNYIFIKA